MLECLVLGFHQAQNVRALDIEAGGACEMDFETGVHADDADILAGRLCAIARTPGDCELEFGGRPGAPHELLQPNAESGGVLRPEAAPVGADTGLHGSESFGIGLAGNEAGLAEIGPDGGQVFLLDPEQIDALAAGDLHHRDLELIHDIGDGAQFGRIRHAAPHAGHHGIGAVLLDVCVHTLIDEARLVIVGIFIRPIRDEVVVECRPTFGAAAGRLPFQFLHDGRNGLQPLGLDQATHVVVPKLGAGAHRRDGGRIVGIAQRQSHQLLDQTGAVAAGGGCLGMRPDPIQRRQSLARNRRDDLALADAVAAADFRIIRQGCNGRHRVQRRPSLVGLAEDQCIAHRRDVGLLLQEIEEPRAIGGLAIKDRTDDPVLLQDKALVDAGGRIAQDDFLAVGRLGEVAGGEEIDTSDLQLRIDDGAMIFGVAAGQTIGENPGAFIERGDEAVADPAMLGALPECVDRCIRSHHAIVNDNPAVHGKAGILGELRCGTNADGHDDHIAFDHPAVFQLDTFHLGGAQDLLGVCLGDDLDAAFAQRLFEQIGGGRIELALHDRRHEVDDRHLHALALQTIGRFQTEKPAADHNRPTLALGDLQHLLDVVEIAIGKHARQLVARHRNDEGQRSCCDDQLVVGCGDAVCRCHRLRHAVDFGDLRALVQGHAVSRIPGIVMDHDVLIGFLSGEDRGEHDAVVIDPRFGVEDRDIKEARSLFEQLFEHTARRHAIANNDQFLSHGLYSAASTKRWRS